MQLQRRWGWRVRQTARAETNDALWVRSAFRRVIACVELVVQHVAEQVTMRHFIAVTDTVCWVVRSYGSYGICIDPGFRKLILPYLDRGMIYCIAHIRGGGEMGRFWYVHISVHVITLLFCSRRKHLVSCGLALPL